MNCCECANSHILSIASQQHPSSIPFPRRQLRGRVCAAVPLGIVVVDSDADLEGVRAHVQRLAASLPHARLSERWCFLDCAPPRCPPALFRLALAPLHLKMLTIYLRLAHTSTLQCLPSCCLALRVSILESYLRPLCPRAYDQALVLCTQHARLMPYF